MTKVTHNILFKLLSILMFLSMYLSSCSESKPPDFEIYNGSPGYVSDLRGKWVVINYWADWCPPCIKEMPELSSFYRNNKNDVYVFAFNFDQLEGEELQEQIVRFKVNVPSLLTDPGELFNWEVPEGLPATYIIDPEGKTREKLIGPQTERSLVELIRKLKTD